MSRGSSWPRRKRQGLVESRSHASATNEEERREDQRDSGAPAAGGWVEVTVSRLTATGQ